ncbi:M48 family metallopeptidase [archaeon]|jgi:heat shock protein HtpX|nr:M48 family metallopeptidase [archaeon]
MSDRISFHDQISRNKLKSFLLILSIFIVFIIFGIVIGLAMGPDWFFIVMVLSIIISLVYIVAGYYNSDKIALASVKAKKASMSQYPQYHHSVEGLCLASGMPKPKLYTMEDSNINAFASGRDPENAVICVTTGALEKLDKQELEGVLAHELSHIANYDIRFMTITAVLVGMIAIIAQIFLRSLFWSSFGGNSNKDNKAQIVFIIVGIALAILAPIVVTMVQMTISRKREFTADASAVKFIRSPTGLTKALKKINNETRVSPEMKKNVSKAVAPLFMSDPFKKKINGLFATHPPIEKRIKILERM